MHDGVIDAAGNQVLLRLPLPLQDVAAPQLVKGVVGVSAAHRAAHNNLLDAGGLGCINLSLLAEPIDLLGLLASLPSEVRRHTLLTSHLGPQHLQLGGEGAAGQRCNQHRPVATGTGPGKRNTKCMLRQANQSLRRNQMDVRSP